MSERPGWHSRGYLPHIDAENLTQFLTWRQADSIPIVLLNRWREELAHEPKEVFKREFYRRSEKELDKCMGSQVLRDPRAARIVQESLFYLHGREFTLHTWAIMPNHVHALFTPLPGFLLSDIMRDMKGFTSRQINKVMKLKGQFWDEDYFDRWMRDAGHFSRVAAYIEWNPVKAKLCQDPKRWPWSSANEDSFARFADVTSAYRDEDKDVRAPTERERLLNAIREGDQAVQEGKIRPAEEVFAEMAAKYDL